MKLAWTRREVRSIIEAEGIACTWPRVLEQEKLKNIRRRKLERGEEQITESLGGHFRGL